MRWTPEQIEILDPPSHAHALVHAVPGAGKITTLVGRVERLCARGVLDALAMRLGRSTRGIAARLVRLGLVESREEARRRS